MKRGLDAAPNWHYRCCARLPRPLTSLCHLLATFGLLTLLAAAGGEDDVAAGLVDFRQGHFAEALQDWQRAADAGDANGALYIGVLYDTGLGVRQNYRHAMEWYKRAAEAGNAVAAFNVGVLYDAGLAVVKDPGQAATWYAFAAKRDFPRAAYNLAMLYESGTGVRRDKARAMALYRQAASLGVSAARDHLAALGQKVAVAPHRETVDPMQDFAKAQQMITSRSPQDVAHAATVLRASADRHNALAEYDLGYCYEHGLGLPRDLPQAIAWYRRAGTDTKDSNLQSLAGSSVAYLERVVQREKPP